MSKQAEIGRHTERGQWDSPAAQKAGDIGAHARLYLDMMAQSDYAEKVAPAVGSNYADVLDIGAGGGSVTRHCLAPGARWCAVEPNPAMGEALAAQRPALTARGIRLDHLSLRWQDLPDEVCADSVFVFNVGDNHHQAAALFDALAFRARREMVWVVPAQAAPASFCLAGFLPAEFYADDVLSRQAAIERTLAELGESRRPARIDCVDWQCRMIFPSRKAVALHFLERLDCSPESAEGRALTRYLDQVLRSDATGWPVACAKRSAVVRWFLQ